MKNKDGQNSTKKSVWRKLGNILLFIFMFAAILITFFVVQFNIRYDSYTVHGASMQPTLNSYGGERNDIVYVCKNRMPKRGDIGVFQHKDIVEKDGSPTNLIKRVIATGGDEIDIKEEQVNVEKIDEATGEPITVSETQYNIKLKVKGSNDEAITLKENYVREPNGKETFVVNKDKWEKFKTYKSNHASLLSESGALIVPDGCYFALGDNRENSEDSAHLGVFSICLGRVDYILKYDPLKGTAKNGWATFGFMFAIKF